MKKERFSKDPKIKLLSIEEFLTRNDYLSDIKEHKWKTDHEPECTYYFKITSKYLIKAKYLPTYKMINNRRTLKSYLSEIEVAFRDGTTEYKLFENKINELIKKKSRCRKTEIIDKKIKNINYVFNILNKTNYSYRKIKKAITFENSLMKVDYKCDIPNLQNKYVVFDVETNGTRRVNDDLLSISIYDPSTGECYNRFLPLDLQPMVLTTFINGINDQMLEGLPHITQDELNMVIDHFDLKNRILLSFSGGKGDFDSTFIINYCKRHNLVGFENFSFENIKSSVPFAGYMMDGQLSKDNLCRLLKIEGVQNVHSGLNDCILEWKLFEKLKCNKLLFIDNHLYNFTDRYIIPVTYLTNYPVLLDFANIALPSFDCKANCIFDLSLPRKMLSKIKKFPTNITGIAIENGISAALNAERQDNEEFLSENKNYLEYIGSLEKNAIEIFVSFNKDGTIKSLDQEYDNFINEVNEVTSIIIEYIKPIFEFIKNNILKSEKLMNQELVLSNDNKVLALCDLSDEKSVLEIKTYDIFNENGEIKKDLVYQLFFESKGRKMYTLSIDIKSHIGSRGYRIIDSTNFRIYEISLSEKSQ